MSSHHPHRGYIPNRSSRRRSLRTTSAAGISIPPEASSSRGRPSRTSSFLGLDQDFGSEEDEEAEGTVTREGAEDPQDFPPPIASHRRRPAKPSLFGAALGSVGPMEASGKDFPNSLLEESAIEPPDFFSPPPPAISSRRSSHLPPPSSSAAAVSSVEDFPPETIVIGGHDEDEDDLQDYGAAFFRHVPPLPTSASAGHPTDSVFEDSDTFSGYPKLPRRYPSRGGSEERISDAESDGTDGEEDRPEIIDIDEVSEDEDVVIVSGPSTHSTETSARRGGLKASRRSTQGVESPKSTDEPGTQGRRPARTSGTGEDTGMAPQDTSLVRESKTTVRRGLRRSRPGQESNAREVGMRQLTVGEIARRSALKREHNALGPRVFTGQWIFPLFFPFFFSSWYSFVLKFPGHALEGRRQLRAVVLLLLLDNCLSSIPPPFIRPTIRCWVDRSHGWLRSIHLIICS